MISDQRKILQYLGTPKNNCYIASEAYFHLCGGKASGLKPVQGYHEGVSHWWLVNRHGRIIDITSKQFKTPVDYSKGRGRGFLTKKPSKRAQEILNAIAIDYV